MPWLSAMSEQRPQSPISSSSYAMTIDSMPSFVLRSELFLWELNRLASRYATRQETPNESLSTWDSPSIAEGTLASFTEPQSRLSRGQ